MSSRAIILAGRQVVVYSVCIEINQCSASTFIKMITPKAYQKINRVLLKIKKDKIDGLAVMIAAGNVLITDITPKGELILQHLS